MKIFSNFKILFTSEIRDLLVDIQPQIVIPIIKLKTETTQETINNSLIESVGKKNISLSLEFSLKHLIPNEKEPFDIENIFPFEKIGITLIRYAKITSENIVYSERVHKPKVINLPNEEQELWGFRFYMSKYSLSFDITRLRKGCQVISLYSNVTHEKRNIGMEVKEAVERLGYLLGVDLCKDDDNFAFQFIITKSIVDCTTVVGKTSISTEIFKIIKSKSHWFLTTQNVSPDDYYIPGYNVETENSEQNNKTTKKKANCTII